MHTLFSTAAGVFGTAKILFQSQLRGLTVSDKLGSRLSCNGNNVAYVAGSSAPLNAQGLDKKQVSNIPQQERPGPSISSSFVSSLGFSIQVTLSLFHYFIKTSIMVMKNELTFCPLVTECGCPRCLSKLYIQRANNIWGPIQLLILPWHNAQAKTFTRLETRPGNGFECNWT